MRIKGRVSVPRERVQTFLDAMSKGAALTLHVNGERLDARIVSIVVVGTGADAEVRFAADALA